MTYKNFKLQISNQLLLIFKFERKTFIVSQLDISFEYLLKLKLLSFENMHLPFPLQPVLFYWQFQDPNKTLLSFLGLVKSTIKCFNSWPEPQIDSALVPDNYIWEEPWDSCVTFWWSRQPIIKLFISNDFILAWGWWLSSLSERLRIL